MVSPCCGAATVVDAYGFELCAKCWASVPRVPKPKQRDLIAWLFPPETGKRPKGTLTFIRQGRSIRYTDRPRGRVDGWSWDGA